MVHPKIDEDEKYEKNIGRDNWPFGRHTGADWLFCQKRDIADDRAGHHL